MIAFARGVGLLVAVLLTLVIAWAAVDAAIRPQGAYDAIGHKKVYWVGGLALAAVLFWGVRLFGLLGIVAAIVYLVEYRPKLRDISRGRGGW
ncbi:MAG: hypothetical protein QOI42_1021 [Frankiaceae bacterium]|jgi:hypothetical protein|nr:hypothetical protein [Frankiaceae bacterium]